MCGVAIHTLPFTAPNVDLEVYTVCRLNTLLIGLKYAFNVPLTEVKTFLPTCEKSARQTAAGGCVGEHSVSAVLGLS